MDTTFLTLSFRLKMWTFEKQRGQLWWQLNAYELGAGVHGKQFPIAELDSSHSGLMADLRDLLGANNQPPQMKHCSLRK